MRTDFLPFSRPSITEADIAAVADVLRSGWITTGPQNAELEGSLPRLHGLPWGHLRFIGHRRDAHRFAGPGHRPRR